jgi:hypothetical protein
VPKFLLSALGLTSLIAAMSIPAMAAPVPVSSADRSASPVLQAQYYYYEHHRYHHRNWDEHYHHWHYYD